MSNLILNDSWDKLKHVFDNLNQDNISSALEQFQVKEICVDGIASVINGQKGVDNFCFYEFLKKLGFSEKDCRKFRMCIIGDCKYTTDIYGMLNHFIGYHEIPAQNIGRLIPFIRDDKRKMPSKTEMMKYNFTHPQMGTD